MTNKAQYKLKLLLGENGSKPLANTAYVITAQGKILSKGSTSSVGETAVFEVVGLTSIQVKIFNPKHNNGKGGYIFPELFNHKASDILDLFHKSKSDLSIVDYLYRRILNIQA